MFDAINGWNIGTSQFGQTSGEDGAQPVYSQVGRDGVSPDLLNYIGYTPPQMPWGGVDQGFPVPDPLGEFNAFLASKGLSLGQQGAGGYMANQQLFDANNQAVGPQFTANLDQDPGNLGMLASLGMAGGFAGATGLAAGGADGGFGGIDMSGGAAGAPAGSGGLAGTGLPGYAGAYTGGTPYALAGDVAAAPEGAFGAAGAAADGAAGDAAGMGLAEGAYPTSLGAAGGGGSSLGSMVNGAADWAKQNPGLVNVGGSLVNGLIGAYSANQALNAQKNAANQANAMWAPYNQFGVENLGRANGLLRDPSSIANDPGYQFTTQQGSQALDRSAASKGGLYSGAQMKAAQQFGQNNANTYFDRILGRYTGAAQLGATGTTNISNNLIGVGNAGAGASMYTGNVAQNGVNSALGNFNYTNALQSGMLPFNASTYPKSTIPPGG